MSLQRRYTSTDRLTRRAHRKIILGGICIGLVGMLAVWYLFLRPDEPTRVLLRFAHALESQDIETIYRLSHPFEKQQLGLTPQGIRTALNLLVPSQHPTVTIGSCASERNKEKQCIVTVRQPDRPDEVKTAVILVVPTSEGWRVQTTLFLKMVWAAPMGGVSNDPHQKELFKRFQAQIGIKGTLTHNDRRIAQQSSTPVQP